MQSRQRPPCIVCLDTGAGEECNATCVGGRAQSDDEEVAVPPYAPLAAPGDPAASEDENEMEPDDSDAGSPRATRCEALTLTLTPRRRVMRWSPTTATPAPRVPPGARL
jgi:hypothetical protein